MKCPTGLLNLRVHNKFNFKNVVEQVIGVPRKRHSFFHKVVTLVSLKVLKFMKKIVTFMWYSNDMFHYMFKAEFVMHS